jgi:hypothetical protein
LEKLLQKEFPTKCGQFLHQNLFQETGIDFLIFYASELS